MADYLIFILFLICATLVGLNIWLKFTGNKATIPSCLIGSLVGTVLLTYVIFIVSWLAGRIIPLVEYGIIIFITGLSVIYLKKVKFHLPKVTRQNILVGILLLFSFGFLFTIFSRLLFWEKNTLMAGWVTVWGDWAAHLTYASSFIFANNFPPMFPVFAERVFGYPFMADFLSALLTGMGMSIYRAMMLTSFWFTWLSFVLLLYLSWQVTKKYLPAILTPLLFFGNGGLGFAYIYWMGVNSQEFTKIGAETIDWMSVMTSQFIPQRGFALGLPLALTVLLLLYRISQGETKTRVFFFAGLLTSLLPLIHMHSFLTLIFLSGLLYLFTAKHIKGWLAFILPVILFATPAIWYFYRESSNLSALRFHLGWLAKTPADVPMVMLKNFGAMLFVPLLGWFFAPRKLKWLLIPFGLLFVLANTFIFQPWDWDNTKIFSYWYIGASLAASIFLGKMLKSRIPLLGILALLIFILCIYSGMADTINLLNLQKNKLQFFTADQLTLADYIRKNLPPKARFLTADNHDNPVPVLTGHQVLMGFPGWLWSYGINYWERQPDIDAMKTGAVNAPELFKKYNVEYVSIGPLELSQNFNQSYFEKNWQKVYSNNTQAIYKIK